MQSYFIDPRLFLLGLDEGLGVADPRGEEALLRDRSTTLVSNRLWIYRLYASSCYRHRALIELRGVLVAEALERLVEGGWSKTRGIC